MLLEGEVATQCKDVDRIYNVLLVIRVCYHHCQPRNPTATFQGPNDITRPAVPVLTLPRPICKPHT
jgi:hypothetical protein